MRAVSILVICLMAAAGHIGTNGEQAAGYVTDIHPADNGWTNSSSPEISFNISSFSATDVQLMLFRDNYSLLRNWTVNSSCQQIDIDLEEGRYIWMLNITDTQRSVVQAGPYHFSVDLSPPSLPEVLNASLIGPSSMDLNLRASDQGSGVGSYHVDLFREKEGSLIKEESAELEAEGPCIIRMEENMTCPLYFRCWSRDRAGNWAGPSPMMRCDPPMDHGVELISDGFAGPNKTVDLRLFDPLGIDEESVIYRSGTGAWKRVFNHTMTDGSMIIHIQPTDGPKNRSYTIGWKDLSPLPYRKYSDPVDALYFGSPPGLSVRAPSLVQVDSVRLSLYISSDEMPRVMVSRDDGTWYGLSNTSHEIIDLRDGWRVDIEENITFGTEILFRIKVLDHADNMASVNWSVEATRPPRVSIFGPGEERIYHGTLTKFIARSSDPENDTLEHIWTLDGEPVWEGSCYSVVLDPGFHNISVNVTDGSYFDTDTFTLYVNEPEEEQAGGSKRSPLTYVLLMGLMVLAAILVVVVIFMYTRKRNREGTEKRVERIKAKEHGSPASPMIKEEDVCEICLDPTGPEAVECPCGVVFHPSCASRAGTCPSCGRELLI